MPNTWQGGFLRDADGALVLSGLSAGSVTSDPWAQTGLIAETMTKARFMILSNAGVLTSGRLFLTGGLVIPKTKTITSISVASGNTAAVTPTNQWFCIVRQSDLAVLAKTVDDTVNAWAGQTLKTLALSSPYVAGASDEPVYIGILVAAATPPNLLGFVNPNISNIALHALTPIAAGQSTNALTTPGSLGANAGAISSQGQGVYAFLT